MLKRYVRGQVTVGIPFYETENGNQSTNLQEAELFTRKQCHKWYWDMRKNAPDAGWGYWPVRFVHTGEVRALDV